MMKLLPAISATVLSFTISTVAFAETPMEQALTAGGKKMTADEISERLAGKTVTFENASNGDRFYIFYDGENGTLISKVGSDSVIDGFYAVSLADHICLGAKNDDPIRLRCVNVVEIDGKMHKFELDGTLRGRVIEEAEGNLM